MAGTGTEVDPYKIESIEDLVALSNNVGNGTNYYKKIIILSVNLDFKNEDSYVDSKTTKYGDINGDGKVDGLLTELTTAKGFQPIGTSSKTFSGQFNGENHTVKNLYINRPEEENIGFFGYIDNSSSKIMNVKLNTVEVTGKKYTGGIVGYGRRLTVDNIELAIPKIIGEEYTGGITGNASGSIIKNSTVLNGTVTGVSDTGGIAGYYGTLINNRYEGKVTGTGNNTGGLNGTFASGIGNQVKADVVGVDYVGLASGYNFSSLTSSIVEGNVVGRNYVSGLCNNMSLCSGIFKSGSVTGTGAYVFRANNGASAPVLVNSSVLVNGKVVTSTNMKSYAGKDATAEDFLNQSLLEQVGFNFTDTTQSYIWYFENNELKMKTN